MAQNAYLKVRGTKQGEIKGSATQKGREGRIPVIAAEHQVTSPRDSSTGMAIGRRIHHPFVITKEIDRASPALYLALTTNENLPEFELQFFAAMPTGQEVQRYTVLLTNASIADIRFHMPNSRNPDLVKYSEYEEVTVTYEQIEWTWTDGHISTADAWSTKA